MKVKMLFFFAAILFSACNSHEGNSEFFPDKSLAAYTESYNEGLYDEEQESNELERKLVTEGNISFESDNIEATRAQIIKAVDKYSGYISSDQEYNSEYSASHNLIIRIPSDMLSDFLSEATSGITKFDSKAINTEDVTENYYDLSTRIKNKKALEKRFVNLLAKTNRVSEILEVEREIVRLRTDIENAEGKLKYLDNRISFSTINFNFYKNIKVESPFSPKFSEGFANGWKNLLLFLVGAVSLWPFIILLVLMIFALKFYRKKQKI